METLTAHKTFDVLRYLVERAGRLVTQEEMLEALWPKTYVNPEVLRKYILEIRKVLGDRHDKPAFIETVPKRGYQFIAQVSDEAAAAPLEWQPRRSSPHPIGFKFLDGKFQDPAIKTSIGIQKDQPVALSIQSPLTVSRYEDADSRIFSHLIFLTPNALRRLTFDMSGGCRRAKLAG